MPILVGIVLPFVVGGFAMVTGLDHDRAFYPLVMIVIASLYLLFALLGGSPEALLQDGAIAAVFIVAAVVGFRTSLWIVVVALAAHGVLDLFHGALVANPGVPTWYPAFCLTYDVVAAGFLGGLLVWRGSAGVGQAARRQDVKEPQGPDVSGPLYRIPTSAGCSRTARG